VVLYALAGAGCARSWCALFLFTFGFIGRPVLYVVVFGSLLPITVRRLRDAQLPLWYAAAILLLFLADLLLAAVMITPAPGHLARGLRQGPTFLASGLLCVAALCLLRSDWAAAVGQRWQDIASIAMAIAAALALLAIARYPFACGWAINTLGNALGPFYPLLKLPLFLAPVILGWMAVRSWRAHGAPGSRTIWFYLACLSCTVLLATVILDMVMMMRVAVMQAQGANPYDISDGSRLTLAYVTVARLFSVLLLPVFLALMQRMPTIGVPIGGPMRRSGA